MFSDHNETSPSIAAVSVPSVACSMLAVQQQTSTGVRVVFGDKDNQERAYGWSSIAPYTDSKLCTAHDMGSFSRCRVRYTDYLIKFYNNAEHRVVSLRQLSFFGSNVGSYTLGKML